MSIEDTTLRESFLNRWQEDILPLISSNNFTIEKLKEYQNNNSNSNEPYNISNVYSGLNDKIINKIKLTEYNLLLCSSDYYNWISLYCKDNIEVLRKFGNGIMCIKGQTFLPYSIKEIFEVLTDIRYRKIIEPTVETCCPIKPLSNHTGIEYLKYKAIWPTTQRDFCNIVHWKLLQNGVFLYYAFSEPSQHFPEREGVVRGNLHLGGYVMKQVNGGTMISIVVQVNLFIC